MPLPSASGKSCCSIPLFETDAHNNEAGPTAPCRADKLFPASARNSSPMCRCVCAYEMQCKVLHCWDHDRAARIVKKPSVFCRPKPPTGVARILYLTDLYYQAKGRNYY